MTMNDQSAKASVGLMGIGLEAYWGQFPGLKERLEGYLSAMERKLAGDGVEVVNVGLVDSVDKSFEAGRRLRAADAQAVFVHATTYALSATVLPALRRTKAPVIVLNAQPEAAFDYEVFKRLKSRTEMTGEWLARCGACPVPELANVFMRAGIPFHQATGALDGDPVFDRELAEWRDAVRVASVMEGNRLGLMGRYYGGMLDIYTDVTRQLAVFGGHAEILELDELSALRKDVGNGEVRAKRRDFEEAFELEPNCPEEELDKAARTAAALERLVERHRLGSLAYYAKGSGVEANFETMASIILGTSLLTGRHVPVAGEYEVKNAQAMKIMDAFGAGGSFSEFYGMDYRDDIVLLGHDGPGHIAIAEGKPKVRALAEYHGKVGSGLSIEMAVKRGPVTLLSVVERPNGGVGLLVAEGESVPGPIMEIGNTNSRYRFPLGARAFAESWNARGPAHHCAIGTGHIGPKLQKLAALLEIPCFRITGKAD